VSKTISLAFLSAHKIASVLGRNIETALAKPAFQSIKEQHQVPDNHYSHHPCNGEREGVPDFSTTFYPLVLIIQRH
jgi:hypothetical protein